MKINYFLLISIFIIQCWGCINFFQGPNSEGQTSAVVKKSYSQYSDYKSNTPDNIQRVNLKINQNTIFQAQQDAIKKAKKELSKNVMTKIDNIYYAFGLEYLKSRTLVKKNIQQMINNHSKLKNTVVEPEGNIIVTVSVDFYMIKNKLKASIPFYLKQKKDVFKDFTNYYKIDSLYKEIERQFNINNNVRG